MKKITIIFLSILFSNMGFSQINFTQVFGLSPQPQINTDFIPVCDGEIGYSDIDNDGDLDLLITGAWIGTNNNVSIYFNDGNGNLTHDSANVFTAVRNSTVDFADIDNDGDDDVLITGEISTNEYSSNLYLNDGQGNFTLDTNNNILDLGYGDAEFADIDNDGDMDLLITGKAASPDYTSTRLYINDGSGLFTEQSSTPFDNVQYSSIKFADIDNDNDLDLFISGTNDSYTEVTKLYINDGTGNFTLSSNTFSNFNYCSMDVGDIDGDGDNDFAILGRETGNVAHTQIYTNDGTGNFTLSDTNFVQVKKGKIKLADIDNDNDLDIFVSGEDDASNNYNLLYENNGTGIFTLDTVDNFYQKSMNDIAVLDIDNDNLNDIVFIGYNLIYTELYQQNINGNFYQATGTPFNMGYVDTPVKFADIDGDGDEDAFVGGSNSVLYTNDGNGNFTSLNDTNIKAINHGDVAFADVNGDGSNDFVIAGDSAGYKETKLFLNNGTGNFTQDTSFHADEIEDASVAFGDVDNDNNPDLLIAGDPVLGDYITKLYINDGNGHFTESSSVFDGIHYGDIAFGDFDNDNDLDIIISGQNNNNDGILKLYVNDGIGNFSENTSTGFNQGFSYSSLDVGDVNNDGYPDVLISGSVNSNRQTILYLNIGNNSFIESSNLFTGITSGASKLIDIDGDNNLDVFITGLEGVSFTGITIKSTKLYINDGSGNFIENNDFLFDQIGYSSVDFGDVNADQKPDLLYCGENNYYRNITKLYLNDSQIIYTNILETGNKQNITLYPNPTDKYIYFNNPEKVKNITLYNTNGNVVNYSWNSKNIDISSLKAGLYIIKIITTDNNVKNIKFIKE